MMVNENDIVVHPPVISDETMKEIARFFMEYEIPRILAERTKRRLKTMNDVIELFDGVKNVEFESFTYCEELGADLPVFTLKEPSAEEWNRKTRIQNAKMFTEIMGRQPSNEQEVLKWIYSLTGENCVAG
jgi:hypothetical protein